MARKKVDPARQDALRKLDASGIEYDPTWPTNALTALAKVLPHVEEPKPEVYGAPKREKRRGPARIEFHAPELITMTQGSGEMEMSNAKASYIAQVIHDGMGAPHRHWTEENERMKQLFPSHSLTPGADAELTELRAWARGRAYNARWPKEVLKALYDVTE